MGTDNTEEKYIVYNNKITPISSHPAGTIIEVLEMSNQNIKLDGLFSVAYRDLKWKNNPVFMIDLKTGLPWLNEPSMTRLLYKIIKFGEE